MIFGDEPLEAVLNAQGLGSASHSVVDSGVGHTSVHSDGNLLDSSNQNADVEASTSAQAEPQVLDPNDGEGPVMTSSPRIGRETKPTEVQIIITESPDSNVEERKDTSGHEIEVEPDSQTNRSRTSSILLLDATGESETDDTVQVTVDKRKVILKSPGEDTAKPKKVVTIQLPTESTSQDQDTSISLTGADEDVADGLENGDDSDFECTSFWNS